MQVEKHIHVYFMYSSTCVCFKYDSIFPNGILHNLRVCVFAVKPMKGDALLFFNLHPNATTDPSSLHGSCPVVEGEKWSATRWIHVKSFERPVSRTTGCVDENESCEKWAKAGECKKNPVYMVGSETDQGYCRKSCKACSS